MTDQNDPIADRSPHQKQLRIKKLRAELAQLGYSVVSTKWLEALIEKNIANEKTEASRAKLARRKG